MTAEPPQRQATRPTGTRSRRLRLVALVGVALGVLTGCSGTSCEQLPALQAEREQRRQAYLELAAGGATPEQTGQADAELHAFERRVYDLEQSCTSRS